MFAFIALTVLATTIIPAVVAVVKKSREAEAGSMYAQR